MGTVVKKTKITGPASLEWTKVAAGYYTAGVWRIRDLRRGQSGGG